MILELFLPQGIMNGCENETGVVAEGDSCLQQHSHQVRETQVFPFFAALLGQMT